MPDFHPVTETDLSRFVAVEAICQRVRQLLASVPLDRLAVASDLIYEAMENEAASRNAARRSAAQKAFVMAAMDQIQAALHDKGTDNLLAAIGAEPNISPAFKAACGCKAHGGFVEFKPRPGEEPERFDEFTG